MSRDVLITEDFLLESCKAKELYHDYAADMPIIDYHCHLIPEEVAIDKRWENITQVWLAGDHYKWRLMRTNGVDEEYCTGGASDWDKFQKYAECMPYLLRNPLYHWTHLEMKNYFGISDRVLNGDTAKGIYEECNARIAQPEFSARGLMKSSKVKLVCTTDDPLDNLAHHIAVAADTSFDVQVLPTWRPDKGMAVDKLDVFNPWVDKLIEITGMQIDNFDSYLEAIDKRHQFFHDSGCRLADHGILTVNAADYTVSEVETIFKKARANDALTAEEIDKFRSAMLFELCLMNAKRDWTQQIHYGVIRNNNPRMFAKLGPDSGFDSVGGVDVAEPMAKLFGRLDLQDKLARTVIYNINSSDNEIVATMLGNFQDGKTAGKMQMGSGWWFLDQMDGMLRQIEALSQLGSLRRFVGMLTDSRSFLSYARHEYFRRILCNLLGGEMERGLIPNDIKLVGQMVQDISYNNAAGYFGFNL